MGSIQKIEGETRIARCESITEAEESVFDITRQIDASNDALDDLNDTMRIAIEKHSIYREKVARAKKLMRRLSSEL